MPSPTSVRIVHLSTVHPRFDTRIYRKMAMSLSRAGYDVYLVVADGRGTESRDGIQIVDIGEVKSRILRVLKMTMRALEVVRNLKPAIVHLHDPELLLIADALMETGAKVVFDSHEDVPGDIRFKPYLNAIAGRVLSSSYAWFEKRVVGRVDGVIGATSGITRRLQIYNANCITVNNYPVLGELLPLENRCDRRKNAVYIGAIDEHRGITPLVSSLARSKTGARLNLCGEFSEVKTKNRVRKLPGWESVDYHGFVDRVKASQILSQSVVGVVTFLPTPNHLISLPNKLFEYLSAGLPVLCSNFDHWVEIVRSWECGMVVDPADSNAIAEALDSLLESPGASQVMGRNGLAAVNEEYNWGKESIKLFGFYAELLG